MAIARALASRNRSFYTSISVFIIVERKGPGSPLTHISKSFNTAFNVGLLRRAEPGAVIDPEGRLEQLDEDRLVCLRNRVFDRVFMALEKKNNGNVCTYLRHCQISLPEKHGYQ